MFAKVQLLTGDAKAKVLTVPDSAVIDSGMRQVVLIQRSEGLFEPREVKLGKRNDGYTEVLNGLVEGDVVVVSANFLIDAESNLKAALSSFGGPSKKTATKSSPASQEGR
jgi:Cu(I)/Ag(I) efflux system membrane fusion protein